MTAINWAPFELNIENLEIEIDISKLSLPNSYSSIPKPPTEPRNRAERRKRRKKRKKP